MLVGCLALNSSFEPLTLVPMRRALRLVIDGKAEIVEADTGRVVRSANRHFPHPVVIRLTKYVHVPRRFRRHVTNTFLFARDHYRCQYCGRVSALLKPRESLTRDHVIPLSRGGDNSWTNVVTACSSCKCGASPDVRFVSRGRLNLRPHHGQSPRRRGARRETVGDRALSYGGTVQ
ncbi:MAG: HNH endonuclease [Gemmatimonadaceae bacterium]|nr:HNH endonuclease [Gemmatimonadaceae bacterium]